MFLRVQKRHEIAKLLRAVLQQGRKFKASHNAPVFIGHGGEMIVDPAETSEMLTQHFATAERGTQQSDLRVARAGEGQVDGAGCIPLLAELAQACRSLQNGRAHGTPAAWRAIALQELAMKAIGKAARQKLLEYFTPGFGVAQGGAVPGVRMELPQALVKTNFRRLRQEKVSGGVVYFDGNAAFHSAFRQFLCDGHFNAEDISGLLDLLDVLDEAQQQELFAVIC